MIVCNTDNVFKMCKSLYINMIYVFFLVISKGDITIRMRICYLVTSNYEIRLRYSLLAVSVHIVYVHCTAKSMINTQLIRLIKQYVKILTYNRKIVLILS